MILGHWRDLLRRIGITQILLCIVQLWCMCIVCLPSSMYRPLILQMTTMASSLTYKKTFWSYRLSPVLTYVNWINVCIFICVLMTSCNASAVSILYQQLFKQTLRWILPPFWCYYAAWGALKPTFRDCLSVPSSRVKLSKKEVVWNQRFGTIYPSRLQGSSCPGEGGLKPTFRYYLLLHLQGSSCSRRRWFETDVSGLPFGPIFKGQAVQEELTLEDETDR
jgi:hypothetical protein